VISIISEDFNPVASGLETLAGRIRPAGRSLETPALTITRLNYKIIQVPNDGNLFNLYSEQVTNIIASVQR